MHQPNTHAGMNKAKLHPGEFQIVCIITECNSIKAFTACDALESHIDYREKSDCDYL